VPAETQPNRHNPVHVLVGGAMLPSSSPNDPSSTSTTATSTAPGPPGSRMRRDPLPPGPVRSDDLFRHRIDDPMFSIFTSDDDDRWTPRRMLDVTDTYTYDSLTLT
jgi:tyrosinase